MAKKHTGPRYPKPFVIQSQTQGVFMGWKPPVMYNESETPRFSTKATLLEGQRYVTYAEALNELRHVRMFSRGRKAYITKLGQTHSGPFQPSKGTHA